MAYIITHIEDTRQYDSCYKPISGTGNAQNCEHCNKLHEVLVTIYDQKNNHELVVGTTCAKKLGAYGDVSTKALQGLMVLRAIKEAAESVYCNIDWSLKKEPKKLDSNINELLSNFDYKISHGASHLAYEMYSQISKLPTDRQDWIKKFLNAGHDFETALQITSYPIAD